MKKLEHLSNKIRQIIENDDEFKGTVVDIAIGSFELKASRYDKVITAVPSSEKEAGELFTLNENNTRVFIMGKILALKEVTDSKIVMSHVHVASKAVNEVVAKIILGDNKPK